MVKKVSNKKEPKAWIVTTVILAALLILSIFTNGFNPNCNAVMQVNPAKNTDGDASETLGQCLTSKGAVMYGAEWCGHCQNQKRMFGDDFANVVFVDCDKERQKCQEAGVTGYPTWIIDGRSYPGEKSLDALAGLAGCNI